MNLNVLKKVTLTVTLLFIQNVAEAKYHHKFVKIEHGALQFVDGKYPGVNGDSCIDCLQVRALINKVLRGKRDNSDKKSQTFIKIYDFKDKKVALDDLVEMELEGMNRSHPDWEDFHRALTEMKDDFLEFTEPLLGEAKMTQEFNLLFIQEWTTKADRKDSLLLNWGQLNEREELYKASASTFRTFCIDLRSFLHDLMYSCPKGRERYKRERISMLALQDAFTQLTKQNGDLFKDAFNSAIKEYIETLEEKDYKGTVKQMHDYRRRHIFLKNGDLSEDVYAAIKKAAPSVDKETFIKRFYESYEKYSKAFDATFTPQA